MLELIVADCGDSDLLPGAAVVRYRRRIDPADVLRAIDALQEESVTSARSPDVS